MRLLDVVVQWSPRASMRIACHWTAEDHAMETMETAYKARAKISGLPDTSSWSSFLQAPCILVAEDIWIVSGIQASFFSQTVPIDVVWLKIEALRLPSSTSQRGESELCRRDVDQ